MERRNYKVSQRSADFQISCRLVVPNFKCHFRLVGIIGFVGNIIMPCKNFSVWRLGIISRYIQHMYTCTNIINRKSYLIGYIGMRTTETLIYHQWYGLTPSLSLMLASTPWPRSVLTASKSCCLTAMCREVSWNNFEDSRWKFFSATEHYVTVMMHLYISTVITPKVASLGSPVWVDWSSHSLAIKVLTNRRL